jgi:hypothetical protein
MNFAKWVFRIAGIYGLLAVTPQYFLEKTAGEGALLPHPEFFYAFLGVAVAFQIVFLIIGSNPAKYRPLMLASVVEKFSFTFSAWPLFMMGRITSPMPVAFSTIDGILGVLFVLSWVRTKPAAAA